MIDDTPPNGFRTFVIVWLSQAGSLIGSALTLFAVNIWLAQTLYPRPEQKPELALAISLMSLAFMLPTIFGAPIAGAWADRHDRQRTMMVCDLISGGLSLVLALAIAANVLTLWTLLPLLLLVALAAGFHSAAFDTSYAMLVPPAQLPRANGMMQTLWSFSGIVSPALAAAIIALPALARQGVIGGGLGSLLGGLRDGAALAMGLDALTFFVSALVLLFVRIPSPKRADLQADGKPRASLWADIGEGGRYIWRRRPLLWLLGTFTVANFVGSGFGVYEPLIVKFTLAADWAARGFTYETALALLGTAAGVGGLIGGVFISAWGGLKQRRVYGVLVPMIISGVAQIVLGWSALLYLTAAMAAIVTGMIPILNAHSQAIWQTQTPRELQGRVFSVRRVIAQCTAPLATFLAGVFGGLFDPGVVLAALGVVLMVFCIAQLFNPWLLRVEDKAWLEALAARAGGGSDQTQPAAPATADQSST